MKPCPAGCQLAGAGGSVGPVKDIDISDDQRPRKGERLFKRGPEAFFQTDGRWRLAAILVAVGVPLTGSYIYRTDGFDAAMIFSVGILALAAIVALLGQPLLRRLTQMSRDR